MEILLILSVLCSALLILVVLAQPGKADMISSMSGLGGQVNNLFGVSTGRNLLQNITLGLLAVIALVAVFANTFLDNKATTAKSALEGASPSMLPQQQQTPPAQPPAQQPAPVNP
jgi:protein translocase SecG subunit